MSAPASGIDVHAYQQRVRGDVHLNSTARLVAFVMSSYAHYGNGGGIRASRETIAKGTGLSVRSVGRAQADLIASGWMSLVKDNSRSGTSLVNVHALSVPEWGTHVPPVATEAEEPVSKAEEPVSKAGERVSHYPANDLDSYPPNTSSPLSVWDPLPEGYGVSDEGEGSKRFVPEALDLSDLASAATDDVGVVTEGVGEARTRFGPRSPEESATSRERFGRRWSMG